MGSIFQIGHKAQHANRGWQIRGPWYIVRSCPYIYTQIMDTHKSRGHTRTNRGHSQIMDAHTQIVGSHTLKHESANLDTNTNCGHTHKSWTHINRGLTLTNTNVDTHKSWTHTQIVDTHKSWTHTHKHNARRTALPHLIGEHKAYGIAATLLPPVLQGFV